MHRPRFSFGRFYGSASRYWDDRIMGYLLWALTEANCDWLEDPENAGAPYLYESGVYYKRVIDECQEDDDWADIPSCLHNGYADCEDFVAWRVAELRVRWGVEAEIGFRRYDDGDNWLYHVFVILPRGCTTEFSRPGADGRHVEDPSQVMDFHDYFGKGAEAA